MALDVFVEVMKLMNDTRLWNAKLTSYSPGDTHWICFYGLEHSIGIYGFRPTWTCLIIEILAIWAKFLEPDYDTVVKCTFTF